MDFQEQEERGEYPGSSCFWGNLYRNKYRNWPKLPQRNTATALSGASTENHETLEIQAFLDLNSLRSPPKSRPT
jgi:hypothetical protein